MVNVPQQKLQGPLVLSVSSWRPESEIRFTVTGCESRAEGRPRPLTWYQCTRCTFLKGEYLPTVRQCKTKIRNGWRAAHPTTAWGDRHHIAHPVGNIEMNRIARRNRARLHRIFHQFGTSVFRHAVAFSLQITVDNWTAEARDRAWSNGIRCCRADLFAPLCVVSIREKGFDRNVDEIRIAIELFPVGECQFRAFRDEVNKLSPIRIHRVYIVPAEQR